MARGSQAESAACTTLVRLLGPARRGHPGTWWSRSLLLKHPDLQHLDSALVAQALDTLLRRQVVSRSFREDLVRLSGRPALDPVFGRSAAPRSSPAPLAGPKVDPWVLVLVDRERRAGPVADVAAIARKLHVAERDVHRALGVLEAAADAMGSPVVPSVDELARAARLRARREAKARAKESAPGRGPKPLKPEGHFRRK